MTVPTIIAQLESAADQLGRLALTPGPEQRRYERLERIVDSAIRDLETLAVREQYRAFRLDEQGAAVVPTVVRTNGPTLSRILSLAAERKAKLEAHRKGKCA